MFLVERGQFLIAGVVLCVLFIVAAAPRRHLARNGGLEHDTLRQSSSVNEATYNRYEPFTNSSECANFKKYLRIPTLGIPLPSKSWCTTIQALVHICSNTSHTLAADRHTPFPHRCQHFLKTLIDFQSGSALAAPPAPVVKPKPIMLLHMSKAGGTSICNLAIYNNLTTHPKANNCWPPFNGPVWFLRFRHLEVTCAEYTLMVERDRVDIIANEAYLDGGATGFATQLCANLTYLTMLRNPIDRTLSHTQQVGIQDFDGSQDTYRTKSLAEKLQARPEVGNNYMTRFLLGKQGYEAAFDTLNTSALHAALRNLLRVDAILVLEATIQRAAVLHRLGWAETDLNMKAVAGRVDPRRRHVSDLTAAEVQALQNANKLDMVVYQAALFVVFNEG